MKIKIDEFRLDNAQPVEAPLDFTALCALLAAHQAATPTARLALHGGNGVEPGDPVHPAIAVLLAGPDRQVAVGSTPGSFHPGAAARFNDTSR